jgi:hypothetical protein
LYKSNIFKTSQKKRYIVYTQINTFEQKKVKQMKGTSDHLLLKNVLGPKTMLFYIERSIDTDIVVYEADRHGNTLQGNCVDIFWTDSEDINKREDVSQTAQDLFFGVRIEKEQKGTYKMCLAAMPSKIMRIHLKKSGKVVAKTIIDGKEARIFKIYAQMSETTRIPSVDSLTIYGEHKKELVCETLEITDEIRKRFDVKNLIPGMQTISRVFG